MFTEEEVKLYHSIKAPEELRQKIITPRKNNKKIISFITIAAACFVLIVSGFLINNGKTEIIINGQLLEDSVVFYDTASMGGRNISSSVSIPIELKIKSNTIISVSEGLISLNGSNPTKEIEISSHCTVWWEIEPHKADGIFEMKIQDKKGVKTVTLKYENGKITTTKENEK